MAGVPHEVVEWMSWRFEGRQTRLVFDDYISEGFPILDGLDQGDPCSVIFANSPLAWIDPHSGIYIDDYHLLAIAKALRAACDMIIQRVMEEGGVNDWAQTHNSKFSAAK
ncbi:hypothetical protein B0H17DRAFT_860423, partial [Mycena rosella]